MSPPTSVSHPSWSQVTVAFALVVFNSAISQVLQLNVGAALVIAAIRYTVHLIVVTLVLQYVFAVGSTWALARLARRFPKVLLLERAHTNG